MAHSRRALLGTLLAFGLTLAGCQQTPPLAPASAPVVVPASQPTFLKLMSDGPALQKKLHTSKWVSKEEGATLVLRHWSGWRRSDGELAYAKVMLHIPPHALQDDAEISLSMETAEIGGGVAVTFEPHGTLFTVPALLSITALGVDFSGVDEEAVDIFYDNKQTGRWERMRRKSLIANKKYGLLRVREAQLPHFSRYAVGMD